MRIPTKRRLGAVLLTLAMVLSLLPMGAVTALAAEAVSIDVDSYINGTVTAPPSAKPGSTVTVTVEPAAGYVLDTLFYEYKNKNGIDLTKYITQEENGSYQFTMPVDIAPSEGVFISATMKNVWKDICDTVENGNSPAPLSADVTAPANAGITVSSGNVTLNLNGHTLTCTRITVTGGSLTLTGGGTLVGAVTVGSGASFVLDDCKVRAEYGVTVNGAFTMNSGTITGSNTEIAGVLLKSGGTFTMTGGTITGNQGGGVDVDLNADFRVSSAASVAGNTYRLTEESIVLPVVTRNVYLPSEKTITVTGPLSGTIGVTTETTPEDSPVVITSGLQDQGTTANFSSDSDDYLVRLNADGEAELYVPPAFGVHALILSSEIGVQFKVTYPESYDMSDVSMDFTVSDGRKESMTFQQAKPDVGNARWFTCYINALELGDTITATLKNGDDTLATNTYSAMQYVQDAKTSYSGDAKLTALLDALQDYGHYMQKSGWKDNLGSHTEIPAASTLNDTSIQAAETGVSGMGFTKNLGDSGIETAIFSLTLNTDTMLNFFVKPSAEVTISSEGYKKKTIDGETYYQFSSSKIGAAKLGTNVTQDVVTSNGTATLTASPMSYVKAVLEGDFNEAQKYAMAAYYNYYKAADAYVNPE